MRTNEKMKEAVASLGGQTAASAVLGRTQATISAYVNGALEPPAEVCMRVEVATAGRFRADALRPDLADDFADFRRLARKSRPRKAA